MVRIRDIDAFLDANAAYPVEDDRYREWLDMADAWAFLAASTEGDVPIYISRDRFFLYSVFVPRKKIGMRYVSDLLKWNVFPSGGWGYGYGWDAETGLQVPHIFPPLDHTGTRALEGAEPVAFLRDTLVEDDGLYIELNQRFAHISGIHLNDKKAAYVRVDEHGDLQTVATVRDEPGNLLCTVTRPALDFYMYLGDSVLVRVFEVNRHKAELPSPAGDRPKKRIDDSDNDLHAHWVLLQEKGAAPTAYLRGFQIVRNTRPEEEMQRVLRGEPAEPRRYATFIAIDFKHRRVHECSCDPDQVGNYLVESDLPYSTSPAFFKPDVIARYKADPDKYSIAPRTITCRSAWSLRYDVNPAGQIHVYLKDLAGLPYSEQLYWKSFNVEPEDGISERSFRNDFLGEWFAADDPLEALKERLLDYPRAVQWGRAVEIWAPPPGGRERRFAQLTYVLTESSKEWKDQILELAKVLVEGLKKSALRVVATELSCDDPQIGSLALLKRCLIGRGIDAEVIDTCVKPPQELQGYRSSTVAHVGTNIPTRDLRLHHRELVERCDRAMETLADLIRAHHLDVL